MRSSSKISTPSRAFLGGQKLPATRGQLVENPQSASALWRAETYLLPPCVQDQLYTFGLNWPCRHCIALHKINSNSCKTLISRCSKIWYHVVMAQCLGILVENLLRFQVVVSGSILFCSYPNSLRMFADELVSQINGLVEWMGLDYSHGWEHPSIDIKRGEGGIVKRASEFERDRESKRETDMCVCVFVLCLVDPWQMSHAYPASSPWESPHLSPVRFVQQVRTAGMGQTKHSQIGG